MFFPSGGSPPLSFCQLDCIQAIVTCCCALVLVLGAGAHWELERWKNSPWVNLSADLAPPLQAAPFFDRLVFKKVKQRLGGNVKLLVSGGAPLAPHVEDFLKVAMCAPVVQVRRPSKKRWLFPLVILLPNVLDHVCCECMGFMSALYKAVGCPWHVCSLPPAQMLVHLAPYSPFHTHAGLWPDRDVCSQLHCCA